MIKFIILLCVSSVAYRVGGSDLKIPIIKSKIRDWGCSVCCVMTMILLGVSVSWWVHCIYFLLSWLSLASYNDRWGTDNVEWYEFLLTSVVMGLAAIPYAFATGLWLAFWVQFAAQVGLFMAVRCGSRNVYVEECGSGASMVLSKLAFFFFR